MKKIILSVGLVALSATLFAQTTYYSVTGRVVDAATRTPLQAASVFAQNTTFGTYTDAEGNFKLQLPNGGYDLIVTFTGFTTEIKRITTADAGNQNILIELKQKEKMLEDVVVKSSNEVLDGLEKYGDFFLENFIGKTTNSKSCTIKNPSALKFYYSKRKDRLKVLATEPLEIENLALGYKIKYTLDSFTHEYATGVSLYIGYPLFEEMQPVDAAQQATWNAHRLEAYKGSMLHFMRSLYQKQLKEEGFEIQFLIKNNGQDTAVKLKEFYSTMNYTKDDSTQTVEVEPIQNDVVVIYNKEEPQTIYSTANPEEPTAFQLTVLSFVPKESILIEQNGYYFEQTDITINQYLGWEKMADMVPYDFKPL